MSHVAFRISTRKILEFEFILYVHEVCMDL
jgi:hypothetical protein